VLGRPAGEAEIRRRSATMGETAQMYDSLTVKENLLFFARLYDVPVPEAERRIAALLERMNLGGKRDLKLGTFSTGMRKRVQLARVLPPPSRRPVPRRADLRPGSGGLTRSHLG